MMIEIQVERPRGPDVTTTQIFRGQKASYFVEPSGNLVLIGIERDGTTGRATFVTGCWNSVVLTGAPPTEGETGDGY